jgi:large subunit ribosomal protein L31
MKAEIITYFPDAKVTCATCGKGLTTGSTSKELADIAQLPSVFSGGAAPDRHRRSSGSLLQASLPPDFVEQKKAKEESKTSPDREIGELGLTTRATEALKKGGILTVGQLLAKLTGEGDRSVLAIAGFGQSSLTTAKKKLRALGYELPETVVT